MAATTTVGAASDGDASGAETRSRRCTYPPHPGRIGDKQRDGRLGEIGAWFEKRYPSDPAGPLRMQTDNEGSRLCQRPSNRPAGENSVRPHMGRTTAYALVRRASNETGTSVMELAAGRAAAFSLRPSRDHRRREERDTVAKVRAVALVNRCCDADLLGHANPWGAHAPPD
jgi:hypothetical protein